MYQGTRGWPVKRSAIILSCPNRHWVSDPRIKSGIGPFSARTWTQGGPPNQSWNVGTSWNIHRSRSEVWGLDHGQWWPRSSCTWWTTAVSGWGIPAGAWAKIARLGFAPRVSPKNDRVSATHSVCFSQAGIHDISNISHIFDLTTASPT